MARLSFIDKLVVIHHFFYPAFATKSNFHSELCRTRPVHERFLTHSLVELNKAQRHLQACHGHLPSPLQSLQCQQARHQTALTKSPSIAYQSDQALAYPPRAYPRHAQRSPYQQNHPLSPQRNLAHGVISDWRFWAYHEPAWRFLLPLGCQ